MRTNARRALLASTVAVAVLWAGLPAVADDGSPGTAADAAADIIEAVAPDAGLGESVELMSSGADLIGSNAAGLVAAPTDPTAPVVLGGESPIAVGLPDLEGLDAPEVADDGTIVYGSSADAQVAVQAFDQGVRLLSIIDGPEAPERYRFPVEVPAGGGLVLLDDGSVDVLGADGAVVAAAPAPWAYDADGREVPTHFEIEGDALVQVVDHVDGGFAYPVVADPSLWQITKCVGAIALAVGGAFFAGAKLLQIKKYISAFGGVTQAAKLVMGATSAAEKAAAVAKGLTTFAAIISGVDGIISNCR